MIAIYSKDGKEIIGLYTLTEYLELPANTPNGEYVTVSKI